LHATLAADDAALYGGPVATRHDFLERLGLGNAALVIEFDDPYAGTRGNVGQTGQDAVATRDESLHSEVGRAGEHEEVGLFWVVRLASSGSGSGSHAAEFAGVAAGQLNADNVGMLRKLDDDVRGQIEATGTAGVVVDDDGDRRGVSDRGEEVENSARGRGEERSVVGRRKNKRVVTAGLPGLAAVLDGLAGALGAAADNQWHVSEAGVIESLAGGCRNQAALGVREMHGFTVGALGAQASDTSAGQPHGVPGDGIEIEILGPLLKEAQSGHIHTRHQRPGHMEARRLGGATAVRAAQRRVRLQGADVQGRCGDVLEGRDPVEASSEAAGG